MSQIRIVAFTSGRQDYGILRSTLLGLQDHPRFELAVWVGGMHLSDRFGRTRRQIDADGLRVHREIDFLSEPPSPTADSARAMQLVADGLAAVRPHGLLILGDRTETLAAAFAATIARTPVIHVHGGEETEGAIDNACRHAITKLSHLHLVSHELHAARVRQMGELPENVVIVGAAGLDNLYRADLPGDSTIAQRLGVQLRPPVALITVHPTTLEIDPLLETRAIATALEDWPGTTVITQPNADAGGADIRDFWARWGRGRPDTAVVDALGESTYWALLKRADVVVGNSSSGIIEAPAAGASVVNVGERQRGRLRFGDVVDVPASANEIRAAIARGRRRSGPVGAVYLEGPAAPRIIKALEARVPTLSASKAFQQV